MSKATEACGLGEAIHRAFRLATASLQGRQIYDLITEMPPEDWNYVLEYVYASMPKAVRRAMSEVPNEP